MFKQMQFIQINYRFNFLGQLVTIIICKFLYSTNRKPIQTNAVKYLLLFFNLIFYKLSIFHLFFFIKNIQSKDWRLIGQ